jgi:hypothetical protein
LYAVQAPRSASRWCSWSATAWGDCLNVGCVGADIRTDEGFPHSSFPQPLGQNLRIVGLSSSLKKAPAPSSHRLTGSPDPQFQTEEHHIQKQTYILPSKGTAQQ